MKASASSHVNVNSLDASDARGTVQRPNAEAVAVKHSIACSWFKRLLSWAVVGDGGGVQLQAGSERLCLQQHACILKASRQVSIQKVALPSAIKCPPKCSERPSKMP